MACSAIRALLVPETLDVKEVGRREDTLATTVDRDSSQTEPHLDPIQRW